MNRSRKLMVALMSAVLLVGLAAIFTPAEAKRPGSVPPPCDSALCDPYCTHWCPNAKSVNGVKCLFSGCNPTTGECTYDICGPK